jgi:NADH-quinone oxidoreductase subunit F
MSKNLGDLSGRKGIEDNLFDKLGNYAKKTGTVEPKNLEELAEEFLYGKANLWGATTFYDFLKPENKGKKVYICNGSACLCAETQEHIKTKLEEHFKDSEIGHMTCLGRCHENGAFYYEGHNYSGNSVDKLGQIIEKKAVFEDKYHVKALSHAVLTESRSFDYYQNVILKVLKNSPDFTLEEIKKSALRGRGGAGFPMGFKLDSCKNETNTTKFVICNADEGDPGAYSDRYLLEKQPFAVLSGMIAAAYVIGAEWSIVYLRAEYPEAVQIVQNAIDKLENKGLLGDNIQDSGFSHRIKIIQAQGAYICGEETALINSIEGQRPEVRTRPPYPTQEGLFNKPTVVNNVETLAVLPFVITEGGNAYAAMGTEKSKGTKLITLDSNFKNPGCYEVEMGVSLSQVVNELGGGFKHPVKALQVGGPLGGIVPTHKIDALSIDFESFSQNGFLLGHGSIVGIPQDFPMIKYLEHLLEFAAYESCGKCFPCRLGTKRGQELISKAINENYKIDKVLFEDLLETLEQGSLCAHGGGIPLPIKNVLHYFEDELKEYFEG